MNLKLFILLFMQLSFLTVAQENSANDVKAKIEVKNIEGVYSIDGFVSNQSKIHYSLTYNILSLKKGNSGNISSSRQSGKFTLLPNEKKLVSESSVNLNNKDALKIYFFVNDEKTGKLISKDSIEINNTKQEVSYETKNINEGDIQIIGLTIDETKTKAGELFYSKLFSFMQLNSMNFKFMKRILELPSINRNTQIQVYAQDTNLLTFNTMPDEDYLDSLVKETIEALFAYQKQKEILDKNFNY